jgi:Uma2 family endonuclease
MTPTAPPEPLNLFPELAGTRRFTADEYRKLIDAGILGPDDHVERLDGYVVYVESAPDVPPADPLFPEWGRLRRFTSAEYHRMIDLHILTKYDKLELLDGYLVLKMKQTIAHRSAVMRLSTRLGGYLPEGWLLMTQLPVSVGGADPEPDGAIVRGAVADYDFREVVARDFGIVIEVSSSTLDLDRSAKGRLYARAGLPVYWIVNVDDRQVEVYTEPDPALNPPAYRTRTDYRHGQDVPVVLDGKQVAVVPVADLIA